jgi:hypothetical protein
MSQLKGTHTVGKYRQAGTGRKPSIAADAVVVYQGTILDPTTANAAVVAADLVTPLVLPKGFRPLYVSLFGSATGTNPTIDVGLDGGNADGLVNEGDADGGYSFNTSGTSLGIALAADTEVESSPGDTAPTGGVVGVFIAGYMAPLLGETLID